MCAITDKLLHFLGKLFRGPSDGDQQTSQNLKEQTASQKVRHSHPVYPDSGRETGTATRVR